MLNFSFLPKQIILLSGLLVVATYAAGPKLTVVEYNADGTKLNTFEVKANLPQKDLVKSINGKKELNIDPKNSQEVEAKNLLSSNFVFNYVCNYREWSEFKKKYPDKEDWEIDELFTKYIVDNHIKLKKNDECFAEELEVLLKAHPCLAKKGNIEFRTKPIGNARQYYEIQNNDIRRVYAVRLTGCPVDENSSLRACTYVRPNDEEGNFFSPPAWAAFVKKCSAEFKKPEIRKMADATLQTAHTR